MDKSRNPPPYLLDLAEATGRESLLEAEARYATLVDPPAPPPGAVVLFCWRLHLPAKHCAIAASNGTFANAHDGAVVPEGSLRPVLAAPHGRRRPISPTRVNLAPPILFTAAGAPVGSTVVGGTIGAVAGLPVGYLIGEASNSPLIPTRTVEGPGFRGLDVLWRWRVRRSRKSADVCVWPAR